MVGSGKGYGYDKSGDTDYGRPLQFLPHGWVAR